MELAATQAPDLSPFALKVDVASGPSFVTPAILTVAQVLASFPAGPAYRGMYVRVSDLFGYVDGVMRCGVDSGSGIYFWQPTTPEYGRTIPAPAADMTLDPLTSPTAVIFTGSIALNVTRNITLGLTGGRPGAIKEIKGGFTSLLGTLNILGTGLGSAIGVALGSYQKYVLDASSGSLQWVRLV